MIVRERGFVVALIVVALLAVGAAWWGSRTDPMKRVAPQRAVTDQLVRSAPRLDTLPMEPAPRPSGASEGSAAPDRAELARLEEAIGAERRRHQALQQELEQLAERQPETTGPDVEPVNRLPGLIQRMTAWQGDEEAVEGEDLFMAAMLMAPEEVLQLMERALDPVDPDREAILGLLALNTSFPVDWKDPELVRPRSELALRLAEQHAQDPEGDPGEPGRNVHPGELGLELLPDAESLIGGGYGDIRLRVETLLQSGAVPVRKQAVRALADSFPDADTIAILHRVADTDPVEAVREAAQLRLKYLLEEDEEEE